MAETWASKKYYIYIFIPVAFILVYIYFTYNPSIYPFPACPSKKYLGISCPGCGGQRAFHHLLHLEVKEAFSYNPLAIISIPYILLGFIFEIKQIKKKYPQTRKFLFGKIAIYIILGIIIGYLITRNIFHF